MSSSETRMLQSTSLDPSTCLVVFIEQIDVAVMKEGRREAASEECDGEGK